MKKILPILALAGAVTASAFGAPKTYAEPTRVRFVAKRGEWKNAKNWDSKKVPQGFSRAYVPAGATLTLDSTAEITESLLLGSATTAPAVVFIENGARAELGSLALHGVFTNANGIVHMRGGALSVGHDAASLGMLGVGTGITCAGRMTMEISGGKFSGGIAVGSSAERMQEGTLRIVGSAPVVTTAPRQRNHFGLNKTGLLEFVCDEKGVATLDFRGAVCAFEGGAIKVDGKAYRGGDKKIALISADKLGDNLPTVAVENFSAEYATKVFPEISSGGKTESLVLKITRLKK